MQSKHQQQQKKALLDILQTRALNDPSLFQ